MMSAPPLTTVTPQNSTTGMYAPVVVAEQSNSGIDLEVVKWSLICVFSIILAFAAATYQYYRKRSALPKAKKAKRKREGKKRKAIEESRIAELTSDPIPASSFLDAFRKKQRKGEIFIEFKGCQKHQSAFPSAEGIKDVNKLKNTSNTVPFDHSRVILEEVPGRTGSDYINASWIDGYHKPKAYIAAQGPCRSTVGDFWRMIWQTDCRCIVMATNLFEHARSQCEKYWHNTHGRYGSVDVWLEKSDFTADFITRTFRIEKAGCNEPRTVRQFQIASWSDHDCPNISSVLEYRRVIRAYMLKKPGPIVVHCSKGCGRTGTFLSIDALLDEYLAEDSVGVYRMVTEMRKQRNGLVGNKDQYELIYQCMSTFIQCGITVISAKDLPSSVQRMSLKDPKNKVNGFEKEFKTLQTIVPPLPVGDCAGGHRAENRRKSRDVMLQPPERARPYLMSHENNESTDFINAVYVDGYKNMNAFIVTQWPLKNTMNDIWRLLYDYGITSLVVLNDIPHSRSFPSFWPNEVGERRKFGPVLVELARESTIPGVISRMFYIKKNVKSFPRKRYTNAVLELVEAGEMIPPCPPRARAFSAPAISSHFNQKKPVRSFRKLASMVIHEKERNDVKVVKMFQLQCWPNTQRVPTSSAILLELLMLVEDWQNKTNPRNPICVMSKNGVSRCGPFCAIHIAYDKLRMEGEIDIFKAVRTVRLNRPQLVENITEYIYCYTFMVILLEILDLGQVKLTDRDGNVTAITKDEEQQGSQPLSVTQTPISNRGCWSTQLPRAFTNGKPNLSRRRMSRSMEFLPQMLPWLISSDFKTYAKKYKFTYTNPTLTFSDESIEYETSNSMEDVVIVSEPKVSVVGSEQDQEGDECYDNPSFVSDILVHNPPGYRSKGGRRKRKSADFETLSLPPDAELRSNQKELERSVRETSVPNWTTVPEPMVPRHDALTTINKSYPPSPEIKQSDRKTRSQPIFSYSRLASALGTPKLKEKMSRKQRSEEEALIDAEQGIDIDDDSSDQADKSVIELHDIIIQEPEDLVIPRDGDTFAIDQNQVTLKIDMVSDEGSDEQPPDFSSGFGRRGRRGTLVRQSCVTDGEDTDAQGSNTNKDTKEDDIAIATPPRRLSPFGQGFLEPRRPMSMLRVGMNYGTLCKQLSKSESGYISSPSDVETRVDLYRLRSRSETDIRLQWASPKRRKSCYKQYSEECPSNRHNVNPEYMVIEERPKLDKDVVINIPEQGTSDEESDQFFQTRLPLHTSAAKRYAYRRSSLKNRPNFSTSSEAEDVDFASYNRAFDELFRKAHGHLSSSIDESIRMGRLSPYTGVLNEPYLFSSSSEVEDDRLPQRHQTPSRNNSRKHKAKRSRIIRGSSSEPDLEDVSVMGSIASLPGMPEQVEMTEFTSRADGSTDGEQHSSPGKDSNNSVIHFPIQGEVNV